MTLTYDPMVAVKRRYETRERLGPDAYDRQSDEGLFVEHARTCGRDLTLYFKRLRKAGCRFRYMSVTEAHKSWWPHFHLLMHEIPGGKRRLTHEILEARWSDIGFSSKKIVGDAGRGVRYVTKYLVKDARTRIRASQRYGGEDEADDVDGPGLRF